MADFVPTCDVPFVVAGPNNRVHCPSGNIDSIPEELVLTTLQPLSIAEAIEISAAIFLLWSIAYTVKFLINFVKNSGFGRF